MAVDNEPNGPDPVTNKFSPLPPDFWKYKPVTEADLNGLADLHDLNATKHDDDDDDDEELPSPESAEDKDPDPPAAEDGGGSSDPKGSIPQEESPPPPITDGPASQKTSSEVDDCSRQLFTSPDSSSKGPHTPSAAPSAKPSILPSPEASPPANLSASAGKRGDFDVTGPLQGAVFKVPGWNAFGVAVGEVKTQEAKVMLVLQSEYSYVKTLQSACRKGAQAVHFRNSVILVVTENGGPAPWPIAGIEMQRGSVRGMLDMACNSSTKRAATWFAQFQAELQDFILGNCAAKPCILSANDFPHSGSVEIIHSATPVMAERSRELRPRAASASDGVALMECGMAAGSNAAGTDRATGLAADIRWVAMDVRKGGVVV
eukprot:jgi/Mesvir1/112/Mv19396-RA.1